MDTNTNLVTDHADILQVVARRVDSFKPRREQSLDVVRGRLIGFDFAMAGMQMPEQGESAIREGFLEGRHHLGGTKATSDLWTRRHIRLRYSAWKRNRVVDENVTPDYLSKIHVATCPITHVEMTRGENTDTDATIDRVFNDGGYAVGNLVVMSKVANQGKADFMPEELVMIAKSGFEMEGLSNIHWRRLASLCSMATPIFLPAARATVARLASARPANFQRVHDRDARIHDDGVWVPWRPDASPTLDARGLPRQGAEEGSRRVPEHHLRRSSSPE